MKNKIISVLLIISVLTSMLFMLTGCGDSDSKSESDGESPKKQAKEVVKEFWNAYEDGDVEKLDSCINWAGYYTISENSMYNYYDNYKELIKDYEDYIDSSDWEDKKEDIEDNEDDYIDDVEDNVIDSSYYNYKFKKVTSAKKLTKGLYQITCTLEYTSSYSDEASEYTDTMYVLEDNDDYKIIYDGYIMYNLASYLTK